MIKTFLLIDIKKENGGLHWSWAGKNEWHKIGNLADFLVCYYPKSWHDRILNELACTFYGIQINPLELSFQVEEGYGFLPPYQYLHVRKSGTGQLPPRWDAATDVSWITMSQRSGSVPEDIRVNARHFSMPAGNYEGRIVFTSDSAPNMKDSPIIATIKLTITPKVPPALPLKIITTTIPDGVRDKPYACQFGAEGGKQPYKWTCGAGLPDGLVFHSESALIEGHPTSSGLFPFTVYVQDSDQNSAKMEYTLNIAEPPVSIVITSPVGGEVWNKGETHNITWTAIYGEGRALNIELQYGNVWHPLASDVPITDFRYPWVINEGFRTDYVIRLSSPYGTGDQSGAFTIRELGGCGFPWLPSRVLRFLRKKSGKNLHHR